MDRLPHVPDIDDDIAAPLPPEIDRDALDSVADALADARESAVSEFYATGPGRMSDLAAAQRAATGEGGPSLPAVARRHRAEGMAFREIVGFYDAFLDRAADEMVAPGSDPTVVADRFAAFARSLLFELSVVGEVYAESAPTDPGEPAGEGGSTDNLTDLRRASDEIDDHVDDITDLARDQSRRISTVADEITTFTATTQEIAATARQVDRASVEAESLATDGQTAAESAIERMETIDAARRQVQEQFEALNERLERIDEVVAALEDIADQTNVLSLNASIEAARAGEAGEGFAVVADEVNALAEEAQSQAAEIGGLVDEIAELTDSTAGSLEKTSEEITEGVDEVDRILSQFDDITDAVTEASDGMSEVATATDTQADSADEVAQKIEETARLANEVTSEVETVSAANQFLATLIDETRPAAEASPTADRIRPPAED
jgi:uncharacterized phage infection (PIP) family protein YhgE